MERGGDDCDLGGGQTSSQQPETMMWEEKLIL